MSVYVDKLRKTKPSKRWPYKAACHLTADCMEEIHGFARCLSRRIEKAQCG